MHAATTSTLCFSAAQKLDIAQHWGKYDYHCIANVSTIYSMKNNGKTQEKWVQRGKWDVPGFHLHKLHFVAIHSAFITFYEAVISLEPFLYKTPKQTWTGHHLNSFLAPAWKKHQFMCFSFASSVQGSYVHKMLLHLKPCFGESEGVLDLSARTPGTIRMKFNAFFWRAGSLMHGGANILEVLCQRLIVIWAGKQYILFCCPEDVLNLGEDKRAMRKVHSLGCNILVQTISQEWVMMLGTDAARYVANNPSVIWGCRTGKVAVLTGLVL